jgi:cytochrome c556
MREHLAAVQQIIASVGAQDFEAVARAGAAIGYSEQMGQMCSHMGAGAPGFMEQALQFHHTADKISHAARAHDLPGVLSALEATLAACTGCHSAFKQRVVDETTWASLVGQTAPRHP